MRREGAGAGTTGEDGAIRPPVTILPLVAGADLVYAVRQSEPPGPPGPAPSAPAHGLASWVGAQHLPRSHDRFVDPGFANGQRARYPRASHTTLRPERPLSSPARGPFRRRGIPMSSHVRSRFSLMLGPALAVLAAFTLSALAGPPPAEAQKKKVLNIAAKEPDTPRPAHEHPRSDPGHRRASCTGASRASPSRTAR